MTDHGISLIRSKRGRISRVAGRLGLSPQTVAAWRQIPLEHVFAVAKFLKADPAKLRPDFFKDDPLRQPSTKLTEHHAATWRDLSLRRDADAAKAIGESFGKHVYVNVSRLNRVFGPSGRPRGRPRRRRALTAWASHASPAAGPAVLPDPQHGGVDVRPR